MERLKINMSLKNIMCVSYALAPKIVVSKNLFKQVKY